MEKTTLYLPDDLKRELEEVAQLRGCSQAELIREAIRRLVSTQKPPRPHLPLFESGDSTLADRIDSELAGFGEQ